MSSRLLCCQLLHSYRPRGDTNRVEGQQMSWLPREEGVSQEKEHIFQRPQNPKHPASVSTTIINYKNLSK
jgi:hypothetical protein